MDIPTALEIVNALADGINPYTGEIFPPDSPYQHPDTVRALYKAIQALERLKKRQSRQRNLPENAGKPWSEEEEQQLITGHDSGLSTQELATRHKRTKGAIRSRLVKLGRIELP